jgi:hypothetical protein
MAGWVSSLPHLFTQESDKLFVRIQPFELLATAAHSMFGKINH